MLMGSGIPIFDWLKHLIGSGISQNYGDTPCRTEFLLCAFFLLLATLHCKKRSTTCALASTGIPLSILYYGVYVYSWERLPQHIREHWFLVSGHCMVEVWSIGRFLHVANNIPEYTFYKTRKDETSIHTNLNSQYLQYLLVYVHPYRFCSFPMKYKTPSLI